MFNHNVLSCRSTVHLENRVFLTLPSSHNDWFNVFHMEEDRLLPGNIMFSKGDTQLYTTDGTYSNIILNLTDPVKEVFYARHFTQISKNEVVFVDTLNNCLKMLDRTHKLLSEYAGVCNFSPKGIPQNGSDPIFNYPTLIQQDNHNISLLYIVDDYIVRMLNISQSLLVTTLIPNADYRIYRGLTQDPQGAYLYLTYKRRTLTENFGIERYSTATNTSIDILTGNGNNFMEGFSGIALYRNYIIVSKTYWNVLVFIDRESRSNFSVCDVTGDCQITMPGQLLVMNGDLYIAERHRISVLAGKEQSPFLCKQQHQLIDLKMMVVIQVYCWIAYGAKGALPQREHTPYRILKFLLQVI